MKTTYLFHLLCLTLACLSQPLRADGFIVVDRVVHVPVGHYAFAPLEVGYHHVDVKIDDQICTTTVQEEFYNPNAEELEGTYLFPIPKNAQIDKFTMQIGDREVPAELLSAEKARAIYEDIVRRRLDPALMEYGERGVLKVRVFPIPGRGRKQVKIVYSEVLRAESGLVSYTYPLNTEKFSSAPIKDVRLQVELSSGQPLHAIYSPSHEVKIERADATHARISYEEKESRPASDFQLFFAPEKSDVALKLVSYRQGDADGYFMLLASPRWDLKSKAVPKDVTFVLDTSGSMAGTKLKQAKKALQFCLANLNETDRFEIVRFSTEAERFFGKLTPASGPAVERAQDFIANLRPTGGTAIDEALRQAMALHPAKSERPYVIIFLTDGEPTVGETGDDAIVANTKRAVDDGTRIFCFGLGNDVNAHLLDRIAEQTHAVSDYVLPSEDIELTVSSFFGKIREPVLSHARLTFPGDIHVTKVYPQTMPDLFKGDQVIMTGRYSGAGAGTCLLEGEADGVPLKFSASVVFAKENTEQAFVPRLWATRRVGYLLDEIRLRGENVELKDEITDVAREFGLITPYTAYLIMEDEETRHVANERKAFSKFASDRAAQTVARLRYRELQTEKAGESAVATARAQNKMKLTTQADNGLQESNAEFSRGMSVPASVLAGRASSPNSLPTMLSPDTSTRVVQYTQSARYVQGRAFYRNGDQWIDGQLSKQKPGREVRLKFGSPEYFQLAAQHPEIRDYLALGQNVKLAVSEVVYDIFNEAVPAPH